MPKRTSAPDGRPNGERARHRALGDSSRVRMLELLRRAGEPLDVQTLADRLDLHVSTVRGHLKTLTDAGLITTRPEQRRQPGRPRRLYSPSSEAPTLADSNSSLLLAQILATALASEPGSAETAEQAGHAWGKYLTQPPQPETDLTSRDAATQLATLHDELGFDPALRQRSGGYELCFRRCPFHDAANAYQDIVCAAHLGLLRGALSTLHTNLTVETLEPFARPSGCLARLAPAT